MFQTVLALVKLYLNNKNKPIFIIVYTKIKFFFLNKDHNVFNKLSQYKKVFKPLNKNLLLKHNIKNHLINL